MDWKGCLKKQIVKTISLDLNKIISLEKIADVKIRSSNILPEELYYAKITLLYDALRTFLEILASRKSFKIYNHECYSSFIREILKLSSRATEFDKLRIIRNKINYYGTELNLAEAKHILISLKREINFIKNYCKEA